ncbi:hypothetical protein FW320_12630 [Azospirillum sp. Vi22]|uniref:hypothetical protein n=1 Tax=Azospirillum baldaniorum TaxID=1064539 RepID=UPI00157B4D04|nr:hypothetical protein [Azospirillum baldaniorum]NUB07016.1 hypothetical protein [Azospirillum baldaniorum]
MSDLDIIDPSSPLPDEPTLQPAGNPAQQADQHQEEPASSAEADQTGADPEGTDDLADDGPKKPPKGVQKRLDELTRNWRDAERDRDHWRDMAMRGGQPPQQQEQKPAPAVNAAPKPEDFPTYDAFLIAQAKHELRQEMTQAEQAKVQEQQAKVQEQQASQVATNWRTQVDTAKGKYADFEAVAFSAPISEPVAHMVAASDVGADLAYHLGKNPDEARRISALPPVAAARELGRLEAKLSAAPPPKPTQAPPPPPTVNGRGTPTRDPNAMSYAEYKAMRMGKSKK